MARAVGLSRDARVYAEKQLIEVEYQVQREQRQLDEMTQNQLPGRGERDLLVRKARAEKKELKTKGATKRRELLTEAEVMFLTLYESKCSQPTCVTYLVRYPVGVLHLVESFPEPTITRHHFHRSRAAAYPPPLTRHVPGAHAGTYGRGGAPSYISATGARHQ